MFRAIRRQRRDRTCSLMPTGKGPPKKTRFTARPMKSRGMIEALRDAGVVYVLLTIAGGVDQLRRFARDVMPRIHA